MTSKFIAAIGQIDTVLADVKANLQLMEEQINQALERGAGLIWAAHPRAQGAKAKTLCERYCIGGG